MNNSLFLYFYRDNELFISYSYKENNRRVVGIEPTSLAWKAKGYSRRFYLIIASISKPNMKF